MGAGSPLVVHGGLRGAWRHATVLLIAAAPAVLAAWASLSIEAGPLAAVAAASLTGAVAGWAASRRLPAHPFALAFDGGDWTVVAAPADGRAVAPPAGAGGLLGRLAHPVIALDVGPWMLLRVDLPPTSGDASASRRQSGHDGCRERATTRRLPRPPARRWLPLAASTDPDAWTAWRAALWNWRPSPVEPLPERPTPR